MEVLLVAGFVRPKKKKPAHQPAHKPTQAQHGGIPKPRPVQRSIPAPVPVHERFTDGNPFNLLQ